jgi:hypothetical protein
MVSVCKLDSIGAKLTLVIGDKTQKNSQGQRPPVEAVQDARDNAIGVQLGHHMGDLCIRGWRHEACVDSHGAGEKATRAGKGRGREA